MSERFATIVSDVLKIPVADVDLGFTPEDVETWDSLNHLRLIASFEEEYCIRLTMADIRGIECLGDLRNAFEKNEK